DRKSTRLNSSHSQISYAVFCLKKKKTMFIGLHFGGHGHGHKCAAMKGIIESDNRRFAVGIASNLYRVFNLLIPAIKEECFLRKSAGSNFDDAFSQINIWLVHHDAKAGMRKFRSLFSNGLHYFRAAMPDVHHPNTTGKVDIAIAIDILNDSPFGLRCKYRHGGRNTARHK